jgi:hypothetical protein
VKCAESSNYFLPVEKFGCECLCGLAARSSSWRTRKTENIGMSKRKKSNDSADSPLDLNAAQIERELAELLRGVDAEAEAVFASLAQAEPETIEQMHGRHAEMGRLLQAKGMEYFTRRQCA